MGANISTEKRRHALTGLSLKDLAAWHLIVKCPRCPAERYLPIAALIGRYGGDPKLRQIVPRLRCRFRTCRSTPAGVVLCSSLEDQDPKTVRVVLVGPGAF